MASFAHFIIGHAQTELNRDYYFHPFVIFLASKGSKYTELVYQLQNFFFFSEKKAEFFNVDRHTGDIYKNAPLINDSLGYGIELEVNSCIPWVIKTIIPNFVSLKH